MRIICISMLGPYEPTGILRGTVPGNTIRDGSHLRQHFIERGVKASFFYGINSKKLGIDTSIFREQDSKTLFSDFVLPPTKQKVLQGAVGCRLSHRAVWAACLLFQDTDEFLILEDDAAFHPDWQTRLVAAKRVLPKDWNVLYLGSGGISTKPKKQIAGEVFEVKYPICLHAYLVRRRALQVMIDAVDNTEIHTEIDYALTVHVWPKLGGVYTMLPRCVDQFNTIIV